MLPCFHPAFISQCMQFLFSIFIVSSTAATTTITRETKIKTTTTAMANRRVKWIKRFLKLYAKWNLNCRFLGNLRACVCVCGKIAKVFTCVCKLNYANQINVKSVKRHNKISETTRTKKGPKQNMKNVCEFKVKSKLKAENIQMESPVKN